VSPEDQLAEKRKAMKDHNAKQPLTRDERKRYKNYLSKIPKELVSRKLLYMMTLKVMKKVPAKYTTRRCV
jgi:hypothetical protein